MEEKPVLVTTQYRGVFFGYITEAPTNGTISLKRARNCVYWPAKCKGFLGLATHGPLDGSRVGPAADITLYGVTCVAECTPEAVELWEKHPWS
jgi:hypothetical protein